VFDQLVLLAAVVSGMAFFRLLRRREAGQRGYLLLVGGALALSIAALGRPERFVGIVAVSLTVLLVVVPWGFEALARLAFNRGRLGLAVRVAGLRAMLMPGAGLGRQQEILHGLALLEESGVDRALDHFRALADDADDGGEIALINEQIVSMLFYGQRWDEGIAHYESRFHPRYAAMRPALALGLLRAYGESGRMRTAAGLLRALEDGPIGADPRAGGLVSQARLTFLAYAGAAPVVSDALTDARRRVLGLSAASGALFRGIALARAGDVEAASAELRRVESLAGAADDRIVDASKSAMARVGRDRVELSDELRGYVESVAERLETFLRVAPTVRRAGTLVATPIAVLALAGGYLGVLAIDRGATGVLVAGGLTPELWHAGSWGRAVLGLFVSADPLALLLDVYALWLAGPLVERIHGTGRLTTTVLLGGIGGLALSAASEPDPSRLVAGAATATLAVVVGALWSLLPVRTPGLPSRARRSVAIPLVLVGVALALRAVPGVVSAPVSVVGFLWAAVVGTMVVGMVPPAGVVAAILRWLAVPLVLTIPVAAVKVAREDVEAFTIAHREPITIAPGVRTPLPRRMVPVEAAPAEGPGLPIAAGWIDAIEREGGARVQLVVADVPGAGDVEARGDAHASALLRNDPSLHRELDEIEGSELPPAFAAAFAATGAAAAGVEPPEAGELHVTALRRNGVRIGLVVERDVGSHRVALVASPPSALDHAPRLYARILADAALYP
jgi:membrane associated rhomboid family serine protease